MDLLAMFEKRHTPENEAITKMTSGDFIRVKVPIQEKNRSFTKIIEGLCIRKTRQTFLILRNTRYGYVKCNFPFVGNYEVEIIKKGKVRQSRPYYLEFVSKSKRRIPERRD